MTEYTQGPWRISHEYMSSFGISNGYVIVADLPEGTVLITSVETTTAIVAPQNEANACLMAAAPDLLEALIDARRQLEEYELAASGEQYNSLQINAAIGRALGER